ncbi:MAG: 4Fe-4S dicluster domain-containing protein [Proteobacteria bacterium]|nr:4Fe-4S dicluster domain-containing protein [Pseudomonadota bacterium]
MSPVTPDEGFSPERRRLLQLLAASAAMATGACSGPPPEPIVPFVRAPEEEIPGKPLFYATSVLLGGYAMGVLVETNGGRPTKVEGNPLHPASLGATDMFSQAAVLQLWDPARSQVPLHNGAVATWPEFLNSMQGRLAELDRSQGAGLHVLTRTVSSPTLQWQMDTLREIYPGASWHQYEPLHRDNELRGSELAFGRPLQTRYYLDRVRVLLSLDDDVLSCSPSSVRYARDLMRSRNPERGSMSRLYALECTPGLLGTKADHRLALAPADIRKFILHLAQALGVAGVTAGASPAPAFEAALLQDFTANPGDSVILPGMRLAPELQALVHALNHRLQGHGRTFDHIEPIAYRPTSNLESIRELTRAMKQGRVETLVILDGNPGYDAPADLEFAAHLSRVPESIHLASYLDETSIHCTWHLPRAHEFEQWSDGRAYDGTANIIQPVIAPLYGGHSAHEVLNVLLRRPATTDYETVREHWRRSFDPARAEDQWRTALREGVVAGTAAPAVTPPTPKVPPLSNPPGASQWAAAFVPDQSLLDGQFANNSWLQEIPRSLSKLTWDNAAYLSPRTAAALKVATGDEIEIHRDGRTIRAGAWVLPGQADNCLTLPLGYGRTHAGPVGSGVGFDAYPLRTFDSPWYADIQVRRTGRNWLLVTTQTHSRMEGRHIVRSANLDEFTRNPAFATAQEQDRIPDHTLYPDYPYGSYQWGMAIDLNACIGCNACTIACQAENNIPVVGKEEVQRGREMHWIRVDRYYDEQPGHLETLFQPVPCMHCERAPCELVCPVEAAIHDSQGLNLQVYNRCVGTRFCSNNCPYKVRRFNFLQYSKQFGEAFKALHNPDVTVRQRGVMEKCTYCVQRIQRGRIESEKLGQPLQDGQVVTACQAACPTQAIIFGNINDPKSMVHEAKARPRNYTLLAELNTRPRTTYLARITNRQAGLKEV